MIDEKRLKLLLDVPVNDDTTETRREFIARIAGLLENWGTDELYRDDAIDLLSTCRAALDECDRLTDALNQILATTSEPVIKAMTQRALGIAVNEPTNPSRTGAERTEEKG